MEDYKKGYEQWLIEGQRETFDVMSLDAQGIEDMKTLIKDDKLAERVFKNSIEMFLDDADVEKVKSLFAERYVLVEGFYEKLNQLHNDIADLIEPHVASIQPKTNQIANEFFEHHSETIRKIMLDSTIRDELKIHSVRE